MQTPLHDIADAVAAQEVHIVALSFTTSLPAQWESDFGRDALLGAVTRMHWELGVASGR
ncbi:hypothetical protein [Caballeronia catudaia]|uniref:hypothetical protein n=1 Tax=Caballeronia catudaia TaxID=1777136 RepID=UPI001F1AF860|nr:hypothetical protein [Caballeronia catudaia]